MKFLVFITLLLLKFSIGVKIECFYDNELFFDEMKVAYTCTVLDLVTNLTDRDITEVVAKNPDQHSEETEIRQIYIIHQKMLYFPHGFTKYFENIEALHAGMNELKYLEKDDMMEFTKLRFLYLYSNHLENLQSDVFLHNLELEYVSFNNNRLVHIGSKLLTPLKKLKTAYFNRNICIDKQAVQSFKEVAEIKLEIETRCSDITDEDLMNVLKQNQERIISLEEKMNVISEQLNGLMQYINLSNKTEL